MAHEPDDWLDEVWCEGAVLMDEDRRELWFFGGMVGSGVFSGRVYEALLRTTWDGWDVRRSTLPDIAAALGVDRARVESFDEPEMIAPDWQLTSGPEKPSG